MRERERREKRERKEEREKRRKRAARGIENRVKGDRERKPERARVKGGAPALHHLLFLASRTAL